MNNGTERLMQYLKDRMMDRYKAARDSCGDSKAWQQFFRARRAVWQAQENIRKYGQILILAEGKL